jgi:hypothetical protein
MAGDVKDFVSFETAVVAKLLLESNGVTLLPLLVNETSYFSL